MQCGKVTVGSISLIQGKVALFMPGGTEKKVNLLERCKWQGMEFQTRLA
jgi:hypothetical protein